MFKYDLKIAFRNLWRNKTISAINILGLTIGISCCTLIYLFVWDELQYDKYFPHPESLYRLYGNNFDGKEWIASQPDMFLPLIKEKIPEVQQGTIICVNGGQVSYKTKIFEENYFGYSDSSVFKVLGWKLIKGNPHTVLSAPFNVVITKSIARKYFGEEDPIGKQLNIDNQAYLTVSGIMEDVPKHSHARLDIFTNIITRDSMNGGMHHWGNFCAQTYLRLNSTSNTKAVETKIDNLWNSIKERNTDSNRKSTFKLQNISDVYLRSGHISQFGLETYGSITTVIGFSTIGLLLLLIACFNYLNLATARSQIRGIETGIRKASGATKGQIITQFLTESGLYALIAIILSIDFVLILMPSFNVFIGKDLSLFTKGNHLGWLMAGLLVIITLGAGLYPALMMAGYKPVDVLKGKLSLSFGKKHSFGITQDQVRKGLVVIQFFITVSLIISTVLVSHQIKYIKTFDAGFNKEQILVINNRWDTNKSKHIRYENFKSKAIEIPDVITVTAGSNIPIDGLNDYGSPFVVGNSEKVSKSTGFIVVDWDYLSCLGATFIQGRNFNRTFPSDSSAVIISESCAKNMELKDPLGKQMDDFWDQRKRTIIGVVKDIYYNPLHRQLSPTVYMLHHRWKPNCKQIIVKVKSTNYPEFIGKMENIWKDIAPEWTFNYFFLDDTFRNTYLKEIRTGQSLDILTGLMIILSLMGLSGLVIYTTNRRTKEIGIRKTHGASTLGIIRLISLEQMKWMAIAIILASPVSWYAIHIWLRDFAYKINLSWWVFVLAGLAALFIALVTIGWQAWRAASRNPVEALRYE